MDEVPKEGRKIVRMVQRIRLKRLAEVKSPRSKWSFPRMRYEYGEELLYEYENC
jgi:hypothetical protein